MNQKPVTVLQILPELESGGVERGTLELADELTRRGWRSLVISGGGRLVSQLEQNGTTHFTWPIGKKSPQTLLLVPKLKRLLRDEQVDIVHVRSRVPAWATYLAWRGLPKPTRPRLVSTCHGLYSVSRYSSVMTKGERVIAISNTVRDYIRKNYPRVDPRNIRLVYRGVDPAEFPQGFRAPDEWRKQWEQQYPQLVGRKVITLPGRLTRYKGHTGFIEVMRRLKQTRPDVMGLIVGGVDRRRKQYAEGIRQLVRDYQLSNVIFTGHRSDIREIYSVSDLVVSMSLKPPEAFGRTTLEALCLGVPVAGYDHSGVGEILKELFPAGIVSFGNVDQMTHKVLELLENCPAVKPNVDMTRQQMLDRTIAVYEELLSERSELARAA